SSKTGSKKPKQAPKPAQAPKATETTMTPTQPDPAPPTEVSLAHAPQLEAQQSNQGNLEQQLDIFGF
ncbi:MAG: hypothetical protein VKK80_10060, partial [Prochlorothrix sp.]|nr:hypothetical protein [Prochlorothrix sp.]